MPRITPLHYTILIKIFEAEGFVFARRKGDHFSYVKEGILRPVVIPTWPEVPVFIIKNNLRTANISRERFFELLEQV
ncbi:type II toxin-antitoxin system HicA family toxin [Desulfatibacillum aliphaticivorans]|uniref:type II toxin-antitoxin system HicA family toxin n=1 Tax=Desulfatibacillum aliphaticivorans TaxID=218208 RepID=UPI0003FC4E17